MRKWLVLVLILMSGFCRAEFRWTASCSDAYSALQQLNFKKAALHLKAERKVHPKNLVPLYIESQMDFLKSFLSEDKVAIEQLKSHNDQRITILENNTENSPYKKFFMGEMYLQKAISRIKDEEFVSAAFDVRRAYKLLNENNKAYPDFKPNLRGLGLIHAAVGSIPKSYQWAGNLIGLDGTVPQGLNELRELYSATFKNDDIAFLRDETIVLLTFLEMNIDRKNKNTSPIRSRFPANNDIASKPLLLFAKCIFHSANAENDSIITLLSNRKKEPEAQSIYYLDFMEGNARLHNLDGSAEACFLKYASKYKGKSYIKSAWQRLAWTRLVAGDTKGYKFYINKCKVVNKGEDFTDEDKQAITEAKNGVTPNVILLRSRLLFDGGYYNQALTELAGKPMSNFTSQKDQLEFTYRLARIFEKTGKRDKAIEFYESTIKNGSSSTYYFAANSALLLGQLYEEENNKEKAKAYYQKTLSIKNHEYQNSLDQKAKAGLNRLGE
jgi:tetratricopeptide (TPR) repeat protein